MSAAGTGPYKNILVIHLESVSNIILWQYRLELGTVWRLMQKSLRFPFFQTASTSTEMSWADVMFMDASTSDHQPHFRGKNRVSVAPVGFLRHKGYRTLYCCRNLFFPKPITRDWLYDTPDLADYHRRQVDFLQECKSAGKPFFLYLNNCISHMAFDADSKAGAKTFSERFRNGYLDFDRSVNFILGKLAETGFWENTLICCFGDHGDELWSHGVGRGYCHVLTPYSPLCRTPMFIYDDGRNEGVNFNMVSSVDLLPGLISLAMPDADRRYDRKPLFSPLSGREYEYSHSLPEPPFAGRPFMRSSRAFLYAHNLFALQLEYDDPEQGLTKGYSVANGVYRLTVSSGGRNPYAGGLELFQEQLDPYNMLNLLNFFELDGKGDIVGVRRPKGDVHPDFALFLREDSLAAIRRIFKILKAELTAFVRASELRAMAYNEGERHVMPESALRRVRECIQTD